MVLSHFSSLIALTLQMVLLNFAAFTISIHYWRSIWTSIGPSRSSGPLLIHAAPRHLHLEIGEGLEHDTPSCKAFSFFCLSHPTDCTTPTLLEGGGNGGRGERGREQDVKERAVVHGRIMCIGKFRSRNNVFNRISVGQTVLKTTSEHCSCFTDPDFKLRFKNERQVSQSTDIVLFISWLPPGIRRFQGQGLNLSHRGKLCVGPLTRHTRPGIQPWPPQWPTPLHSDS